MLLVLPAAWATEPAFACDPLAEPADGLPYADAGARSESVFDRVVAAIRAEFEPGCPRMCDTGFGGVPPGDCYADDCVTSAGTHVVVDYRHEEEASSYSSGTVETWDAALESAAGDTVTLLSDYTSTGEEGGGHGYYGTVDWAWSAAWTGQPDPALPADQAVVVTSDASVSYDGFYDSYWSTASEAWDDGTCAWSIAESHDYWPTYLEFASWHIVVGAQTLDVPRPTAGCEDALVRDAVLDGVTTQVVDPGWTPYVDTDGDGADVTVDCDDTDATRGPCAEEVRGDGIDQDCDGVDPPAPIDLDGDGYESPASGGADCDDGDPSVHPGATEVACDGVDQDCNGGDLTDGDGDGYPGTACGGMDCDDTDAATHPGATDRVGDGLDQSCDGLDGADHDADGYASIPSGGDDCRDGDADVHPGADDVPCDGQDQDCDGADAPCPDTGPAADTDTGAAALGPDDTGADATPADDGCGGSGGCGGGGGGALFFAPLLLVRRGRSSRGTSLATGRPRSR